MKPSWRAEQCSSDPTGFPKMPDGARGCVGGRRQAGGNLYLETGLAAVSDGTPGAPC